MNKIELKTALRAGKALKDILPITQGEDCLIYKGEWPAGETEEVIYIPDLSSNEILYDTENLTDKEIERILSYSCTKQDFLFQAYNNPACAKKLFQITDWQNPDIQDLKEAYSDKDALEAFEETWTQMEARG